MKNKITWTTVKRKLSLLIDFSKNPRQLTKQDAKDIQVSLNKFGLADPFVINTDNVLIGGHQRKRIMLEDDKLSPDTEVDVRVPDRTLTEKEVEELNIRLNKNVGHWDFDTMANNFEVPDLLDWGFTERDLQIGGGFENPDFTRPEFDGIIEQFVLPKGQKGVSAKDGNWFYVEYYGNDAEYQALLTLLKEKDMMKSPHEVKPEFFTTAVKETLSNDG